MAILAQLAPTAGQETLLYTVPLATAKIDCLLISNRAAAEDIYWVRIEPVGKQSDIAQYVYPGFTIDSRDVYGLEHNITLSRGDKIFVTSTNGTLNFNLFGNAA